MILDSGLRTEFETGAVRDMHMGKGRFDLLPWNAIMEVSKHCENGALKYGGTKLTLVGAHGEVIDIIVGTVVFFIAISGIFSYVRKLKKEGK